MSVLIKGMAMPQNCVHCELFHDEGFCIVTGTSIKLWGESRNTDCPLVELPDHGDLIDRDALFDDNSWDWFNEWGSTVNRQAQLVADAPAVIPAERSEDGET